MNSVVGSWELVAIYRQGHDGSRNMLYGENPHGRLTYTADGIVHAILVGDDRTRHSSMDMPDGDKAQLFQTMVAYSGTYVVEGTKVTHCVDVSWNEVWTRTDLVRFFEIDGKNLRIITAPTVDPFDSSINTYVVEWQKREVTA